MTTSPALTALVCLAMGALVGWLVARTRAAESAAALRADHARLTAELAHRDQVIPDQLALLDSMQQQLRDSFEALAASALTASTQQFLALADQNIGNVPAAVESGGSGWGLGSSGACAAPVGAGIRGFAAYTTDMVPPFSLSARAVLQPEDCPALVLRTDFCPWPRGSEVGPTSSLPAETGKEPDQSLADEIPSRKKNPAAVALGRLGGKKGGKARAAKLTPEQRSAIARKAAQARWSKKP